MAELTTDQKGAAAEAAVAAVVLKHGFGVARPLSDERYDLILDLPSGLLRVQCEWSIRAGDVVVVRCRRSRRARAGHVHRQYKLGEIDAVAGYCSELETCYLLPLGMSVGRATVQLRLAPPRNNQREKINWARDYELGATLSRLTGP